MKGPKDIKTLSEQVRAFFRSQRLRFRQTKDGWFETGFRSSRAAFVTLIDADDESRFLGVYTICPLAVPKAKLTRVTELITRINYLLVMGNFDIDLEDGRITARMAIKLADMELDRKVLEDIIFGNWVTMNHFFTAIASVLFADISPRQALAKLKDDSPKSSTGRQCHTDEFPSSERFNR